MAQYIDNLENPFDEELKEFADRESVSFAEREYECGEIDRSALRKGFYWGCAAGAQWQKQQNTLEEKELDLEKALDNFYKQEDWSPTDAIEYDTHKDIARHFFELGLKARKENKYESK